MDLDFPGTYFTKSATMQVGCRSDAYDRYYFEAKRTVDPAKRQELLQKAAEVMRDEAWSLYLLEPMEIFAMKPEVNIDPWPGFIFWSYSLGRY